MSSTKKEFDNAIAFFLSICVPTQFSAFVVFTRQVDNNNRGRNVFTFRNHFHAMYNEQKGAEMFTNTKK